ncbi:MAG: peroxidase [Deltaproteobacteria bacterium]|nr:peroxidase [Deltaproteobacteria bacterium]
MALFTHGQSRGINNLNSSGGQTGKFGRLFHRPPLGTPRDPLLQRQLANLAATMIENPVDAEKEDTFGLEPTSNLHATPAGFTYLGQMIDHDLTFDPASKLQKTNDPDSLIDFRTPAFDLDCLYGSGPDDMPYLYDQRQGDGFRFLIEQNRFGVEELPRNGQGIALLGDKRNNENQILGQLHLAFLQFHNRIFDSLSSLKNTMEKFEEVSRIVRHHYQWIVLTDFLPRIVRGDVLRHILPNWDALTFPRSETLPYLRWDPDLWFFGQDRAPFIPVEFAVAAYRFGHSMVRLDYALNTKDHPAGKEVPIFDRHELDLRGFEPLKPELVIEWNRFFGTVTATNEVQPARSIDTLLVSALGTLPSVVVVPEDGNPGSDFSSLAFRNLMRGVALGLPSGQEVARAMGLPEQAILQKDHGFSIGPQEYTSRNQPEGKDPSIPTQAITKFASELTAYFADQTPLWYYILKEAEVFEKGQRLGWVGGRIVAEVFLGLLHADPSSCLNQAPGWQPQAGKFGCSSTGVYTMENLLSFVGALAECVPSLPVPRPPHVHASRRPKAGTSHGPVCLCARTTKSTA